jgi:2,5-diamino-6-(ribosylamino)-4(3H)-pyrimidinone 5'-phosphate reductase
VSQRPYVLVNVAVTADGKIDTVERSGARISGATDTARVDRLRAEADAVMVGGHTLLGEDPRLTVRDASLVQAREGTGRPAQPTKVGVVSAVGAPGEPGGLPIDSRFLHDGGGHVLVHTTAHTDAATCAWLREEGAEVMVHDAARVDLEAVLTGLAADGVERLMVEGGSTLVAALLEADLVDELRLAVAPLVFGGEAAPTPVGGAGRTADEAIRLTLADVSTSDDGDVILRYRVDETRDR